MNKSIKVAISVVVAIVLVCGGFIGGFAVAATGSGVDLLASAKAELQSSRETTTSAALSKRVGEVQNLMDRYALEPSNIDSATVGALDGLLSANGDQWASYFPPVESQATNEELSGEFSGIGIVLTEKGGQVVVGEVYSGTPAEKAGVKEGDRFVAINGKKQNTWTSEEVSKLVRGKKGTKVTITFFRPSAKGSTSGTEYTKTITRDSIAIKNVMTKVYDGVGYIAMGTFNAKSTEDISNAIKSLDKQGVKSYVLDLRYNGGGLLDQAVGIASLFIDKGVVVQVEERGGKKTEEYTTGSKITNKPLVMLVNDHTASASEVLTGCLKDYDRATVVGEKTYGKGSVQQMFELSFGGEVKFTIAHWLTPKGSMIDKKGIKPDIEVKAAKLDTIKANDYKTDPQLLKAVETAKSLAQ